ncbi:MAG: creatininase family protein [candidate division Zixibacteria bacterium]|nr:creatininase family protein [candidate division Zixibacteria bacterium]
MAGVIYSIEKLSFPQIDSLDRDKTITIMAVSPLEEHGPHLPVGVDMFTAEFFARHTAELIIEKRPDCDVLMFPTLPLGTQVYKHIGSFYIKPGTLYDIVYNTGRSIARYGFVNIFVINTHGPPKQFVTIESACRKVSRQHKVRMVSLSGGLAVKFLKGEMYDQISRKLNRQFTDEEKYLLKHDFHAGWWETAMTQHLYPDLVDESYKDLKPCLQELMSKKVLAPNNDWPGYYGAPAKADTDFAKASIEVFTEHVTGLILRSIDGEDIADELTSPFYKYPFFRPFFKRNLMIGLAVVVFVVLVVLVLRA